MKRKIVKIAEELCTGCGNCVAPCAEGAIVIENGKAKVVREELCDGAGYCIGLCPTGALSIEEREAPTFDREAAERNMAEKAREDAAAIHCFSCGSSDEQVPLLPVRLKGEAAWVCTRCLPRLIHG